MCYIKCLTTAAKHPGKWKWICKKGFFSCQESLRTGKGSPGKWWSHHPPRKVQKTSRCGTFMGMVVFGWSLDLMTLLTFCNLRDSTILWFGVTTASRRIKLLKVGKGVFGAPCVCYELEACVLRASILFFFWWKELQSDQSRAKRNKIYKTECEQFKKQLHWMNLSFFLCDICQSKEQEIKTRWDCYWLISPAVTVCTMSLHVMAS